MIVFALELNYHLTASAKKQVTLYIIQHFDEKNGKGLINSC
jgi:hypothetical protein